ncbi:MAG: aminomethyl-transferring glycine dehydrogenase [Deltaproteobacteria bacterium]|nr:aminomethyl-transferring glycine dehydrogenase [Deltaproteobacteria bacterium]
MDLFDRADTPNDTFARRHLGSNGRELAEMLEVIGVPTLDALADEALPKAIRTSRPLAVDLPVERGERAILDHLRRVLERNKLDRSLIGMGYYDTIVPPVIQRNVLENPGWYTQYTPYQAEISQGRLEALLNYQTMICDLTGLPLANASLLDEATAGAEAMTMAHRLARGGTRHRFIVAGTCHPQTIAVMRTRARPLGITVDVGGTLGPDVFGAFLQNPGTDGRVSDLTSRIGEIHSAGALAVVATDLLALTLFKSPGEMGADIALGSSQRFGVPLGFGGPHAAFMATREDHARQMPGRLIGVSKDARGLPALRMALQTREQHIRREKATSNICTAQVLLAVMAGMYGVWHGPDGLVAIARRVYALAKLLSLTLESSGTPVAHSNFFDTVMVPLGPARQAEVLGAARARGLELRAFPDGAIGVSFDEACDVSVVESVAAAFGIGSDVVARVGSAPSSDPPVELRRTGSFMTHPVFHRHHTEHEMLRYIRRLESKDLSLTTSMIPLGSCTMKLNATSEMLPLSWAKVSGLHPYVPSASARGYADMIHDLDRWLSDITGFAKCSFQPNAGSQGEYAGLLTIRAFHASRGQAHRNVCLIPVSAHGTNPASATMAGLEVVPVACDAQGNVDLADLERLAKTHAERLAALMITYPSTHGVFEEGIKRIAELVHAHGGQVYLDGANLNALVGLARPGELGADVCHVNLHKTFCIPHGGGGPGMGPIGVALHLVPFLPTHPLELDNPVGPVAGAPFGSASILTISWMYMAMMGGDGLTEATKLAIANANYLARRLSASYEVLYTGPGGRVAHEFIIDLRPFKKSAGIEAEDVAKRLMDFGFHAPTMSFPVAGTLMIEPTESESKAELDRLADALLAIREEIRNVESGTWSRSDNPLKHAPHPASVVTATEWVHGYSREVAAFPAPWLREHKFWPSVARIDNPWGDRNLMCSCPPTEGR